MARENLGGFAMIESPFHHDTQEGMEFHAAYGLLAYKYLFSLNPFMVDGVAKTLTPVAPHLVATRIVTQQEDDKTTRTTTTTRIISDHDTDKYGGTREGVIDATNAARASCDVLAVFTDLGISSGMKWGMKAREEAGKTHVRYELPLEMLCDLCAPWSLQQAGNAEDAEALAATERCPVVYRKGETGTWVAVPMHDAPDLTHTVPFKSWVYGKLGARTTFKRAGDGDGGELEKRQKESKILGEPVRIHRTSKKRRC